MFARQLAVAQRRAIQNQTRKFTVHGQFQKDELAAERDFINKEERALLQNLAALQQKKAQVDYSAQTQSLSQILVEHKVEPTPDLVQNLMKWRLTPQ
eukprot:UN02199